MVLRALRVSSNKKAESRNDSAFFHRSASNASLETRHDQPEITKDSGIPVFYTTDTLKPLMKTELEQMKSVNSVVPVYQWLLSYYFDHWLFC
jgi:hypothetical protein